VKRITRTGVFVAATTTVVIGGTLVSYAGWIAPASTVSAKARAGSMPPGVTPSAAIQNGQAVVSWSAQEILPGVEMTTYVVTAHDTASPAQPSVAHTVTASGAGTESATFTAAELAGGKWKWAIIPKLQTWTGAEGKLGTPKLVFPAAAPATVLAAAVTAVAATGTSPPTAPALAPAGPTPAATELPTPPTPLATGTGSVEPTPTATNGTADPDKTIDPDETATPDQAATPDRTAAPDKTAAPDRTAALAKTELLKAGPAPSDSPATHDPAPSTSAAG
jgi:hypothetical protein